MSYQTILMDRQDGAGLITLNRPDALNALNGQLVSELCDALVALDQDDEIGAIVIAGSDKAFAAGADIKEMADKTFADVAQEDFFGNVVETFARLQKPVIAAVSGYALGGGCELALSCDFIIAGENAKFGQPEIKLGVIPGIGGSQRLTRVIGKSKAMDMILTGRMMDAAEAERSGLASRVVPVDDLLDTAIEVASQIAGLSRLAVARAKEVTNRALETTLAEGLLFERRVFHSLFATEDQKEGMAAFTEKREPMWKNR